MTIRQRMTVLRRRWCLRRGHPMASWSPVCMSYKATATRLEDGTISEGAEITQRAYRCARHDRNPTRRIDLTIDLCR
jgi:hypothetical protein